MAKTKKRKTNPRILADFLTTALGCSLSLSLPILVSFPKEESVLVGWTIAILIAYSIRPHPPVSFMRWTLERLIILVSFYLFIFKVPLLLKPLLMPPLAYGIPISLFLAAFTVWVLYGRNYSWYRRA